MTSHIVAIAVAGGIGYLAGAYRENATWQKHLADKAKHEGIGI